MESLNIILHKRITKNFVLLLIEKSVALLVNIILILILPIYLSYYEFGEFITAFSIVSICWIFLELGFNTKIIKEIAYDKNKTSYYISHILLLKVVTSIIIISFAIILLQFSSYSNSLIKCTFILLFSVFAMNLAETFQSAFKGFEKMSYSTSIFTISNLIIIAGCFSVLKTDDVIINIAFVFLIGRTIYFLISFAVFLTFYKSLKFNLRLRGSLSLLYDSITRIPAQIFLSNYYNQGIIIVSILSSQKTGSFGLAAKIITSLVFILTSFYEAILPIMSEYYSEGIKAVKEIFIKTLKILLIVIIVLIPLILLLFNILIENIYSADYVNSYSFLIILIIALPFMLLISLFQYFLASINMQKKLFYYLVAAFIGNFILSIVGFKIAAFNGLAGAIIVTSVFLFLIVYFKIYRGITKKSF